jgi:methionine sulfoxide reductase heme-binding subunit
MAMDPTGPAAARLAPASPAPASLRAAPTLKARLNAGLLSAWARPVIWLLLAGPFAWYFSGALMNTLGANPAEALLRGTGLWTLKLLWLTLAISPLRRWTGLTGLARTRRWFGVATFVYATLHFLAYAWLDMGFDAMAIWRDLAKRPFALVGFAAFVAMVPLALTSFNRAIRALGATRWQQLHRLVFGIAGLGLVHFLWMRTSKGRIAEVAVYAAILAVLLGVRWWARRTRTGTRSA